MALSEFEIKRVEKLVGDYIETHRPAPEIRSQLDIGYRLAGQSLEIFTIRPAFDGSRTIESAVAKATWVKRQNHWQLYWQRQDLRWHAYDPRPFCRTLEEVLAEIEADPHCCFWG